MSKRTRTMAAVLAIVAGLAVVYVVVTAPDAGAFPRVLAKTTLVSQSAAGIRANYPSTGPAISDDGAYVAFGSDATNLVAGDWNGAQDVFRKNVFTGAIDLVSVDSSGVPGNLDSTICDMSSDGRYVVFSSRANNLDGVDANNDLWDIYVRDMATGTTERVNRSTAGDQADRDSRRASISDDGRYVAFESMATNLADHAGRAGLYHVYLRDRQLGTTVRVDTDPYTYEAGDGDGRAPAISDDGRYVAFASTAADLLTSADTNGKGDVFRWDRATGFTVRASVTGVATEGDGASFSAAISANGQTVAFVSQATNFGGLRDPMSGQYKHVYVRHLAAHTTELVEMNYRGTAALGLGEDPSISDDGRYVSFSSDASNLVGDANRVADVFVRDLSANLLVRVSVTETGTESNGGSYRSAITGDGLQIAFDSSASNLVANDRNWVLDVFAGPVQFPAQSELPVPVSPSPRPK